MTGDHWFASLIVFQAVEMEITIAFSFL